MSRATAAARAERQMRTDCVVKRRVRTNANGRTTETLEDVYTGVCAIGASRTIPIQGGGAGREIGRAVRPIYFPLGTVIGGDLKDYLIVAGGVTYEVVGPGPASGDFSAATRVDAVARG